MKRILFFLLFPLFISAQNSWNMNFLGSITYPTTQCNDIWGWVDSNENEYALVGLRNGVSCVDVTDPYNPVEMFFISDIYSIWRDVKTYGNYAYVTTESDAGLLIIDLTDMSGNTFWHVKDFINSSTGANLHWEAAHDLFIDENGICYIFGASNPNFLPAPPNGAIFLDLNTNPIAPTYLGEWNEHYIHDGMVRGDTMYVGCIYDGSMQVVDVSDKLNPITIGLTYTPDQFTHNAWVSENGNFVFTTDEKPDAYLTAYNISDLNNIQEVDRIQSNPGSNSIPHNTFVDGNFLITSYYRDGTTVHDITYPNHMIQVAYYDSYYSSGNGFDGCWGTYPYLPSGNIISSDINSDNGNGQLLVYGRDFRQACYLQGVVTDCQTNLPLPNVSIELLNINNVLSSNLIGEYQTAVVDSGIYQIVCSAPGYENDTIDVELNNGLMYIQDIVLCPPCSTFNIITNTNVEICEGTTYAIGNSLYHTTGLYTDTIVNYFGCDSVINTNLTVLPNSVFSQNILLCYGDSIIVGDNTYHQTGVFLDTIGSVNGCDSIITTNLTVFNTHSIVNLQDICEGDSYNVGSSSYTMQGNYIDTLVSIDGCDSIINTDLMVHPVYNINQFIDICDGDFLQIGQNIYDSTGIYYDTLNNSMQCDSIIITELNVASPIVGMLSAAPPLINIQASGGVPPYDYVITGPNNFTYNYTNVMGLHSLDPSANGDYSLIVTDAYGCQSSITTITVDFHTEIYEFSESKTLLIIFDSLGRRVDLEDVRNFNVLYLLYSDGSVVKAIN